tara:strand:+ start:7370 stop:7633 length:264 start_codon:yes stop_codon:yes gene_type:complete
MARKKRNSYYSMSKNNFLDLKTGPYERLDNTAWYLKKNTDGKIGYFLNMSSKYQQMPNSCFEATALKTPNLNIPAVQAQIKNFMEKN